MFELSVKARFSAAHQLLDYPGNCARFHGHNWEVTVTLRGDRLNRLGICLDFREIKQKLEMLIAELDHTMLNQHPAFKDQNPTSETLARHLFQSLRKELTGQPVEIARVTVAENSDFSASYWE